MLTLREVREKLSTESVNNPVDTLTDKQSRSQVVMVDPNRLPWYMMEELPEPCGGSDDLDSYILPRKSTKTSKSEDTPD